MHHFVCLLLPVLINAAMAATSVPISNQWNGGFQGDPCITFTQDVSSWTAHLIFDSDVNIVEVWVATATKIDSRDFQLDSMSHNSQQSAGDTVCFTFVARCDCTSAATTTIYVEGMDDGGNGGEGGGDGGGSGGDNGSSSATKDYGQVLGMSILFYDAQRSGPLPADNPISWRGDSAVDDCVPGGWYDAGDHVKFGLPMASSSSLLLWSLIKFKDGYQEAGQLDMMYDMIKWPLDYFLDAWDSTNQELVVQVGDGDLDHAYWGRPEEMTMNRPCQTVSTGSPGSDVAGETAAALAAGAIAFQDKGDTAYASQLLSAAESLYIFAKTYTGVFYGASQFYSSSGYTDELCLAAISLYKATDNSQYLTDAQSYADNGVAWALSWDDKKLLCQTLLYEETQSSTYKTAIEGFFNSWMSNGVSYTPCGLAWRDTWGSNRYAGNAAFAALLAAETGIQASTYRTWAVEQINYMLGDNNVNGVCFSFVVGYGTDYPQQPHHRGASCPDLPASCGDVQQYSSSPNPQVLKGALVGGPDASDNYEDKRTNYVTNEVATDYNSGFQGALAGIVHLEATNNFPVTNNACPCSN